jgi:hypothetical protein
MGSLFQRALLSKAENTIGPSAVGASLLKHPDFSQTIDRLRKQLPSLAASGYRGIGVPDCVRSGQEAAKQVLNL